MPKVDFASMSEEAVEKWLADQERERNRKLRSGEIDPEWDELDLLEEEIYHDLDDREVPADDFWAKGWVTGYFTATRTNYDEVDGLFHKAFPTRYRLDDLELTKSLRKVINRNEDLARVIRPLRPTPKKDELEERFDLYRYGERSKNPISKHYHNIRWYPTDLMETCVFDGDELLACSIFQIGELSAFGNYAIRRPGYTGRSLGTLTVLLEMLHAKKLGKKYYYLGSYCKYNPWYQYKTRFSGLELYDWDNERWVDYHDESVPAMLDQKLPFRPEVANEDM